MQVNGNDTVINKLWTENDEVVFNLVALIREQNGARINTDGKSFITAQSDAARPIWVYANALADKSTERQLFSILSAAIQESAGLSINAQDNAEPILRAFAEQYGLTLKKREPLNAYFIKQVRDFPPVGEIVVSTEKDEKDISVLIKQAAADDGDGELTDEQAAGFAKTHACSGNLYLWKQDGKTVSMARIVRYGKFARITSVVTERAARGNGYAKMLVGELCSRLLKDELIPVLYARSENPSSNRCYHNIGFIKAGEIREFRLDK